MELRPPTQTNLPFSTHTQTPPLQCADIFAQFPATIVLKTIVDRETEEKKYSAHSTHLIRDLGAAITYFLEGAQTRLRNYAVSRHAIHVEGR